MKMETGATPVLRFALFCSLGHTPPMPFPAKRAFRVDGGAGKGEKKDEHDNETLGSLVVRGGVVDHRGFSLSGQKPKGRGARSIA